MATYLYLIPRADASDGNTVGVFSVEPPPEGTIIFDRYYGAVNSLESVIAILSGYKPELLAMTGVPVAIRLILQTPGQAGGG